jgi:plasmid stabilization system protein ParE
MSGYVLHPEAFNDLDEIEEFIAKDNFDAADRVLDEIYTAIQLLATNPGPGHRRPDLTSRPLRFWLVYSYLILPIFQSSL